MTTPVSYSPSTPTPASQGKSRSILSAKTLTNTARQSPLSPITEVFTPHVSPAAETASSICSQPWVFDRRAAHPATPKPKGRLSASIKRRRNGSPRNHPQRLSANCSTSYWSSSTLTTPNGPTAPSAATPPTTPITRRSKPAPAAKTTPPTTGSASTDSTPEAKPHCGGQEKCITSEHESSTPENESPCSSTTPPSPSPNSPPAKS